MTDEKILTIVKGEEFKICIQEKIRQTDIFYDQYVSAAGMLDTIVANWNSEKSAPWYQLDSENNIIAFCGERGEGKSSAMISFVNAAYRGDVDCRGSIFAGCANVKKTYFGEPIVIDPSMLDGVHNVLDIVLATLYRKFQERYEADNGCVERYQRESLLDQFQKVYRCISLINNQSRMLDDEYDYEGNIGKLSKLGESTRLRREVEILIRRYLKVMPSSGKEGKTMGCLLIAIDDLDLCSSSAYKMAEQIRKYLIIPNVAIIMAIKIEQLDLCVKEQNLKSYQNIIYIEKTIESKHYTTDNNEALVGKRGLGLWDEVNGMSERYVAKLIPRARRNYLPNVQTMHNVRILYRNREDDVLYNGAVRQTMNETLLDLIYSKTGMKFLANQSGENSFLPDNLRDTVNIIVLLSDMQEPVADEIYDENIQGFCRYYEKEWLFGNLNLDECKEIQKLIQTDTLHLHEGSAFALRKFSYRTQKKYPSLNANFLSESNDCFWSVMSWVEYFQNKVFGSAEEKEAYAFHILYTIRLNELVRRHEYEWLSEMLGGYLWAGNFNNILPAVQGNGFDRSRFTVSTMKAYNRIYNEWDSYNTIPFEIQSQYYAQKIFPNTVNRNSLIISWLILGILANTYSIAPSGQIVYRYFLPIVSDNYAIANTIHISLENYLVSLCNLYDLKRKLNIELLGIGEEEFRRMIDGLEAANADKIKAVRRIVANMDLLMELKTFCYVNKESKEGGKDDLDISAIAVKRFFRNISLFVKKHFGEEVEFDSFRIAYDDIDKEVCISHLYALLIQEGIQYNMDIQANKYMVAKDRELTLFSSKLREWTEKESTVESVSRYLVNKSAENAKRNLDNLASNIQRYYSIHKEERLEEPKIMELCGLYGKILDFYVVDPAAKISDELSEEYKRFYQKYQMTCQ